MRRIYLLLMFAAGIYFDSIFFARINLGGIRPDVVMAMIASFGLLAGSARGAGLGAAVGLLVDILFGKMIGLSAIGYMICGAVGGLFYQKYYADNIIIPAAVAALGAFTKENIMAIASILNGARMSYPMVLGTYILPCMLMTLAMCMIVHGIIKRIMAGQLRAEKRSGGQIGGE